MQHALHVWLFTVMMHLVPPAQHAHYTTAEKVEEHYGALARAVADYVTHEDFVPFVGGGDEGRARSALWLIVIPARETHYNLVIDAGGSVRKGDNDRGLAVGPWQTHWTGNPWKWSRDEIASDVDKQLAWADVRLRESVRACKHRPVSTWMTAYATGKFDCRENAKGAAHVRNVLAVWEAHPFVVPSDEM